jgi:predicted DNA-binding transcriptional regulator AlpA
MKVRLVDSLPQPRESVPTVEPLLWTLDMAAHALSTSRPTLERLRASGRFPQPDLHIGKRPMWKPSTVREWIERGGQA